MSGPSALTVLQAVALTDAWKVEGGWQTNCPCDLQHKGMCSIRENDLGALLIKCEGGCKFYYLTRTLREKRDQQRICA
jgi:hypothetical protein